MKTKLFIVVCFLLTVGCEDGWEIIHPVAFNLEKAPVYGTFHQEGERDTVAILVFGNSFSYDALYYLPSIANGQGKTIISGNLVLGGCSLERHWTNVNNGFSKYDYFKDYGTLHEYYQSNYSTAEAFQDERWDLVIFQQSALYAGDYSSYFPHVFQLQRTVEETLPYHVAFAWHQTWAFPHDSDYESFEAYKYSQEYMYECIVAASCRIASELEVEAFFPSGTAIQNMRSIPQVGDNLCSDNRHLNDLGRYTVACLWYEVLFGENATNITYRPSTLNETETFWARYSAHCAVERPWCVSPSCQGLQSKSSD